MGKLKVEETLDNIMQLKGQHAQGHLLQLFLLALLLIETANGYSVVNTHRASLISASTTTAPPPPRTDKRTGGSTDRNKKSDWISPSSTDDIAGKLEYLSDDRSISRLADEPFHIILLGETFSEERMRITLNYVASSLEYVLGMPGDVALDHSNFAKENGLSCLGTWKREECLVLGSQLLVRDIVCRVVPYCEGGGGDASGWQAKDVTNSNMFE